MPRKLTKSSTSTSLLSDASTATANTASNLQSNAPSTFNDGLPLPRLIVFDLDYTLWPFWVDTHVTPPLKPDNAHTAATDRYGESFAFYEDVPVILYSLRQRSIAVGAASRTSAPELGREMLRLLHVQPPLVDEEGGGSKKEKVKKMKAIEYFDYLEIYPGSKITHFERLRKASGLEYEAMLFFDDESRNRNVETLGVTMYLVRDGVSCHEIDNGVREWRRRRGFTRPAVTTNGNGEIGIE